MTASGDANASQVESPPGHDQGRPRGVPNAGSILRGAVLCLASLAAMLPWPLLGIVLTRSSFDNGSEAALLFGGITLFQLMVLAIFSDSNSLIAVLLVLVWLAAAVIPNLCFAHRLTSSTAIIGLLFAQTAFSFAQAFMGALLVMGKSV